MTQKLFEPTIKQYIALMRLGVIPMEKVVDGKWIPVLDEEWDPVYDTTTEVLGYGGTAGWGKSVLISRFLKESVEKYPGTRWFLARNELKRLKQSTLLTFFETLTESWYVKDGKWPKWYTYFDIKGLVQFNNGSVVHLLELGYQPGDPHYGRIGSTEYTGGAIDEAAEIDFDWFDAISSRVRYKLESFCHNCAWEIGQKDFIKQIEFENPDFGKDPEVKYTEDMRIFKKNIYLCPHCKKETAGLTGRVVCSFNPDKGRVYTKFYRKFKEWNLPSNYAFIPALPGDNPYLPQSYIQRLYWLGEVMKQRLLYGNFDYDDTPWRLFSFDKLLGWFEKPTVSEDENATIWEDGEGYKYRLIIDPAREWKDLATFFVMNHLSVEEIVVYWESSITELESKARELAHKYWMNIERDVLVDEGWVGWWLKDALNCRWFIAHASAIQPKQWRSRRRMNQTDGVSYHRLRDQCYHLLSLKQDEVAISLKKVSIYKSQLTVEQLKRRIIDDMDAIVQVDIDKDAPFRVMPKQQLKTKLGRSPDFGDLLMMAMFFYIRKPKRAFVRKRKK